MLRLKADHKKHYRVLFGSYCKVHDEPEPSSSTKPRTHPAIALGPSGNLQGTVKFYSLDTGVVLRRRNFTLIPMPKMIMDKVNQIGKREQYGRVLAFSNHRREPFPRSYEVPMDDPTLQGLLEPDTPYPDLPGVLLEDKDGPQPAVEGESEPDEKTLTARVLENAGLGPGQGPRPEMGGRMHNLPQE